MNLLITHIKKPFIFIDYLLDNDYFVSVDSGIILNDLIKIKNGELCFRIMNKKLVGYGVYSNYHNYIREDKLILSADIHDIISYKTIMRKNKIKILI